MRLDKTEIEIIANQYDWSFIDYQENIGLISFSKEYNGSKARINVYLTKGTVATCINHPKHGKTQLFRKGLSIKQIKSVFENPRIHTGFGYHNRSEGRF